MSPTMNPSATGRKDATFSTVTPLPRRSLALGHDLRTRRTSSKSVARPVPLAGDDQRVGEPSLDCVTRGLLDRQGPHRNRVLYVDVRQDERVRAKRPAKAKHGVRVPLDDSLVGQHRARKHIDADERAPVGSGQPKTSPGVVPKDVETDRQPDGGANSRGDSSHASHRFRTHAPLGERHIAEVLDLDGIRASLFKSARVRHGALQNLRPVPLPTG